MSDTKMLGVGEAAVVLNARPRDITALFYNRQLRLDICPLVSGRRIIPEFYLETIARELCRNNKPVNYNGIQGGDK